MTTINRTLAEGYRELIASLGYKAVVAEKLATLYGKACGPKYEVQFTPHETVFRLPRKVARQKLLQRLRMGRAITAVRECESVPVRCIEVGSPDGVFLVSESFIPTHNSSLGRLGLIVHATAGFCDPGWKGTLTLELNNLTRVPIKLYPGLEIAQLSFMTLDRPAQRPYGSPELGSHYQGQRAARRRRCRRLPRTIRPAAENSRSRSLAGSRRRVVPVRAVAIQRSSGMSRYPSARANWTTFCSERPRNASLRPKRFD